MGSSWWVALGVVVVLSVVATVADGWGRGRRTRRSRDSAGRPRAAEVWWAAGAGGAEDRPCLVIAVRGRRVLVAGISGGDRDGRAGVIPLPPGSVGDTGGRTSYLETGELREVPVGDLRRRVGAVDPALWDQVRHLAR